MGELDDIGNTFKSKDTFKKREMFIHLGFFFSPREGAGKVSLYLKVKVMLK